MSYYYKHNYSFSYHGMQRVKERLNMKGVEDFKVKDEVMRLIKLSNSQFETRYDLYISAGNSQLYFVINKESNLIVTCTKVSVEKQLELMGGW
ncbi:hypothetical protein ELUMI_v1c06030 [Williamsoniiplasma luminosum]|uniref:DUF4258 domain-containing protein n=1 Tax=Williamsoniiplasma luminosum TaxID=214888 RepID=A0A2K8NTZ3_9MOLU|nr:hypothetical protein [Williamsoniiplasma luminosum]ATZ17325.1 hypothetical protein ELUMI_v1c06030 [Williamsoniiplasma luminosum]